MNVFYDLFKSVVIAILLGFIIFGGYSFIKTSTEKPATLTIPNNTQVLGTEARTPEDLCTNYQKPQNLDLPTNIQKNIGYQNNKFGLYIYRVDEFARKAAEMVNSNGGDWGYVLIPYNVKDYDNKQWNKFFDVIAEERLIPIIQLWDVSEDPQDAIRDTKKAAEYLNSLNWPIEKRYISVYNEVNDERFWKTGIDPEGYAELLDKTIDIFKEENEKFFMLNGAFNASARTGKGYLDAETFLIRMNNKVPGIFEKLDGWASHPYPHIRGYLGKPTDVGRDSIRAYEWELELLEKHFKVKDLPVFITETGWPHTEGEEFNNNYYNEETVAEYLKQAFEEVWLPDDRIVAVTPFTIKYDPPHDHFSFIKKDGSTYKHFEVLKDMPKIRGIPPVVKTYDPLLEKCQQLQN